MSETEVFAMEDNTLNISMTSPDAVSWVVMAKPDELVTESMELLVQLLRLLIRGLLFPCNPQYCIGCLIPAAHFAFGHQHQSPQCL